MSRPTPFPIASIVLYDNRRYLVEDIDIPSGEYALTGCEDLGSKGFGCAWLDHSDLTLISDPTEESWNMLRQAAREYMEELSE